MNRNREVDRWFSRYDNPHEDAMLRVREIILMADARMSECIKWRSPTFSFEGNLASFNPRSKQHVSLLFHTGASIPGKHPRLEGGGDTARYMRFADMDDVEAQRGALEAVVRAWCAMKSGKAPSAKSRPARRGPAKKRVTQKKAAPKKAAKKKAAKNKRAPKKAAKQRAAPKKGARKRDRD